MEFYVVAFRRPEPGVQLIDPDTDILFVAIDESKFELPCYSVGEQLADDELKSAAAKYFAESTGLAFEPHRFEFVWRRLKENDRDMIAICSLELSGGEGTDVQRLIDAPDSARAYFIPFANFLYFAGYDMQSAGIITTALAYFHTQG